MYTKGASDRYVLDTAHGLVSLLDYTAANGADGDVKIELDINSLYFKDNFDAFNSHYISFTSFKQPAVIRSKETNARRHANTLCIATTNAVTRRAKAIEFQHTERLLHARFVKTSKVVFR